MERRSKTTQITGLRKQIKNTLLDDKRIAVRGYSSKGHISVQATVLLQVIVVLTLTGSSSSSIMRGEDCGAFVR